MADFKPSQVTGDLNVTQEPEVVLADDTDTDVVADTPTTIVTFLMTASDKNITRISASAELYGKFDVLKNSVQIETQRSGPTRNVEFIFQNFSFVAGDTVDVRYTHSYGAKTPEANATIYGF
jgi:hypothetical protein